MRNLSFLFQKGVFFVLTAIVLAGIIVSFPTYALWGGDCAGFVGGSLTVATGEICTVSGPENITDLTVEDGGILQLNGATLSIDLTADIIGQVDIDNSSTLNVTGNTRILFDTAILTNNGTFNTSKLFVGDAGIDGGQINNYGTIDVTFLSAVEEDCIYINEGQIINYATGLFSYNEIMRLQGTLGDEGVFENHGLVDAGESRLFLLDYSLLDIRAGRFVMGESSCRGAISDLGIIRMESSTGFPEHSKIEIASGAVLGADFIEVGWPFVPASGQIVNNGTIDKIDLAGNPMACPVEFRIYENSIIDNKTGGLIDLGEDGNIDMYANTVFNNEAGAFVTGGEFSEIGMRDINVVFNQEGSLQSIGIIYMGSNSEEGGTLNAGSSSVTTVTNFSIGNQSGNMGGIVNLDAGGEILADNLIVVEGNGKLYADGHVEGGAFFVMSGDASAPFVELNDTTRDYDFDVLVIETPEAGFTAQLDVNANVAVNINGSIFNSADGIYYSGIIGSDNELNNNGDVLFNLYGTLNIADDPVNPVKFLIDNVNARLTIGPNGFLNIDEEDGWLEVNAPAPYGLVDLSDNLPVPVNEGVDVECEVLIDGNYETNNRLDAVGLLHIKSNGDMHSGMNSVVTVEGSDTIVDGFYELDGILNAGNLTVTSTGHISSGNDPLQVDTNFLINAVDVVVESGGQIASDGVSSRGAHADGPGSYGGEGKARGAASTYGRVKMDETFAPLYGESGITAGVPVPNGGGGVRIHSTGSITIDGLVGASGTNAVNLGEYGGAGGTVIIVHEPTDPSAFFKGSGNIYANGNGSDVLGGQIGAGGGRISIISPLIDYPDFGSNDFTGFIEAGAGANSLNESGAAGTIYFGGDRHNPNGTLIVNQLGQALTGEETRIPDNNEIFDRIEVLGGGNMTWEDDPGLPFDPPTPPAVCYETNGTITFVTLTCADYRFGDKPDTLYMSATNAQAVNPEQEPGYQATDGVSNADLVIAAERPVFSVIYRNPVDFSAIEKIQVQIDNDADFSSPIWDYEKDNLTKADGADVFPNERTKDIRYNEDGTAVSALIPGTTYYIRVRFITNPPGLWSHGDYNDQYKFTTNPPPPPVQPSGGGAGGRRPMVFPEEEPEEQQPSQEELPESEPEPEPEPQPEDQPSPPLPEPEPQPEDQPSPPEPQGELLEPIVALEPELQPEYPPMIIPSEEEQEERVKVPVKKPLADQEDEIMYPDGAIKGCTRADITDRILTDFNLYELLREKDEKCKANWQYCMLPLIIHSNYDITESSYYPDVFDTENSGSDLNPLSPTLVAAIEFGTRNAIVQGYYQEPESPFRPYENMNKMEILKLLNWVTGQKWIYYEEFISQIGGEQELTKLKRYAIDINEWWHIRYHNYACESGLLECDSFVDFNPDETCSIEWLDETIDKYKQYYDSNDLAKQSVKDTDNDSISDDDEKNIYMTDFQEEDTDNDNLNDGEEINIYKTNPIIVDTDYDNLDDGDEINIYKTNPLNPDTDGDGVPDGVEVSYGTDPNDPGSKPVDLNDNGIADDWERKYQIESLDGTTDTDGDGLSDLLEYRYGTDPLSSDTDGDGLTDSEEALLYLTDPLRPTDLSILGVRITNIKDGMIITDKYPTIQGFAPKSGMEILLILKNEFGHELLLGKTITDENNIFIFKSDIELQDGQFYLMAKGMDPGNNIVLDSPLVFVKLDSVLDVDSPQLERISTKMITDEVLLESLRIEIEDKTPVLYGRTGYNNKVIATWQSVIGISAVIADISGNEFSIPSPKELAAGTHMVSVYSIREIDQAMSGEVTIYFEIVEPEIIVPHEAAVSEETKEFPWWMLSVAGLILAGAIAGVILIKKFKPPNINR